MVLENRKYQGIQQEMQWQTLENMEVQITVIQIKDHGIFMQGLGNIKMEEYEI